MQRRQFHHHLALAASTVLLAAGGAPVHAADPWPNRPVRLVVPFAPGGSNDVIARRLAMQLTTALGQSVVVDNRAGGGSTVGANVVATAPADGYTLLFVSGSLATAAAVQKTPYDPLTAFTPISRVASAPFIVLTREGFPARTMGEFIAYAKANPGKINYGSAGLGDSTQLATELLGIVAGLKMEPVGYKGIAPAQMDLTAGRLDLVITTVASIRGTPAEKLPMLAFTSEKRNPDYPQVPTVKEATGLDYVVDVWWGAFGPKGLPGAIRDRLNKEIAVAVANPEFATFLKSAGALADPSTPDMLQRLLVNDVERWSATAKRAGISPQ
jgi:tripartite-type tricarboxylate transporter receptor subunit TctC